MKYLALTFLTASLIAYLPPEEATIENRKQLANLVVPQCLSTPEGGFVYHFNPAMKPFIESPFTKEAIGKLKVLLKPHLEIPLTKEGFPMASPKKPEDQINSTNYSAIWVRDAVWCYYGLKTGDPEKAKMVLESLLRFYTTDEQFNRFYQVIKDPSLANPKLNPNAWMDVPLIRFSAKTLSHHQINGKDQKWNHLQFASHGIFLLAVIDALESRLIDELSTKETQLLALLPAFFNRTDFYKRDDAGPWEEELMHSASSIGIIAASIKAFNQTLLNKKLLTAVDQMPHNAPTGLIKASLNHRLLESLYKKGVWEVNQNLSMGGQAPDLKNTGYGRLADSALYLLVQPEGSLFYNDPKQTQAILNINQGLIGPYGVFRYKYDAYQAMNYWISSNVPSAIHGPNTRALQLMTRFKKGYMPALQPFDAQWFFDSMIAATYYNLSLQTPTEPKKGYYLRKGDLHLKRALGQLTGPNTYSVDGEKTHPFALPESIGTVFDVNYEYRPMPSPICPLSWSTSCMRIALDLAEKAHL